MKTKCITEHKLLIKIMLSHERWLHEIFLFYNISSILEHAVIGLSNLFILFQFPELLFVITPFNWKYDPRYQSRRFVILTTIKEKIFYNQFLISSITIVAGLIVLNFWLKNEKLFFFFWFEVYIITCTESDREEDANKTSL